MNSTQVRRLVATVPPNIDQRQRARLTGYADTALRCEARIRRIRQELEDALLATDGSVEKVLDGVPAEPNAVLTLASELDSLERLQPRVDAWLCDYVAALVAAGTPEMYGDGAPT